MIMDFVRGQKPAAATTGTEYSSSAGSVNMQALLEEVSAIRRLLEERK